MFHVHNSSLELTWVFQAWKIYLPWVGMFWRKTEVEYTALTGTCSRNPMSILFLNSKFQQCSQKNKKSLEKHSWTLLQQSPMHFITFLTPKISSDLGQPLHGAASIKKSGSFSLLRIPCTETLLEWKGLENMICCGLFVISTGFSTQTMRNPMLNNRLPLWAWGHYLYFSSLGYT